MVCYPFDMWPNQRRRWRAAGDSGESPHKKTGSIARHQIKNYAALGETPPRPVMGLAQFYCGSGRLGQSVAFLIRLISSLKIAV